MSEVTVPVWASFFDAEAWTLFTTLVEEGVRRRNMEPRWFDQSSAVEFDHPERGTLKMGLSNLAQMLHQVPDHSEWKRMIGHHLRVFFASLDEVEELKQSAFAEAKDELKVRLYPAVQITDDVPVISLPVMPGIVAVLARDLPDSVVTVDRDQAKSWGLEERDLFALALHNTLTDDVTQEVITLEDGVKVVAWTGDSFFVASRVLALERWLENPAGAFVVIPNRHLALFHPIEDGNAVQAMYDLWAMAQQPFKEGPGSLSGELFHWTPGRFIHVPVVIDEVAESMSVEPPQEVVAALQLVLGPELEA